MNVLLRDVEVEGRRSDVLLAGGRVAAIGAGLPAPVGAEVVAGGGGALLPGLHDHHLHLLSMAAALDSVDCGPGAVRSPEALAEALRRAPGGPGGWVRGTGYHEDVAGPLDRHLLDRLVPDRPVRVQHRSGALWMVNSRGLGEVAHVLDQSPDVERDAHGRPTGRLWRYDARLRPALADAPPDLARVGSALAAYGITGVTDATPDLDPATVHLLGRAVADGALPQRVVLLGAPTGTELPPGLTAGPRKLLLRDHDLPPYDELAAAIADEHAAGRPVAVHCVTRDSLLLTLTVLDEVGPLPGDRVEHAAVVPEGIAEWMARLGVRVVTQPDFLRTRGGTYRREVDPDDLPHLYPYAGLLGAGVPTCASSDAPFGVADPWQVIASAIDRTTADGDILGAGERVPPATALAGYLCAHDEPGGTPRRVFPGAPADLVLLRTPLDQALAEPDAGAVAAVWRCGRRLDTTGPGIAGHRP
ncbi:amidohydrolase family protein [Streptomyces viridosporus]|uniref:amidohydrolase family protein n=1 Tax=Streptomyces viridosporus TaxID=67581 RepID=UPI00331C11EA